MVTSRNLVVCRNPDQSFTEVDKEVLMLSVKNGEYYRLNSVASFIWRKLENPICIQDIIDITFEQYFIEDEIVGDIDALIVELLELELIKIRNEH